MRLVGIEGAAAWRLPGGGKRCLVMGLTTLLWVSVALLTDPEPEALLNDFYQRVFIRWEAGVPSSGDSRLLRSL